MKKFICLISLLPAICFELCAQTALQLNMDSLRHAIPVAADTMKVKIMNKIGKAFLDSNPDSASVYLNTAAILSDRIDFTAGTISNLGYRAALLLRQNNYDEAIKLNLRALDLATHTGNRKAIGAACSNLGADYFSSADYVSSLNYTQQAVRIMEELKDVGNLAQTYGTLGELYFQLRQPDKGYEAALKGISICRANNDKYNLDTDLRIAGNNLRDLGRLSEAMKLYLEALSIARSIRDDNEAVNTAQKIADMHKEAGEYEEMKKYADECLSIATRLKRHDGISRALQQIAWFHFYTHDFPVAKDYAKRSLDIAEQYQLSGFMKDAHELLSQIELAQGNLDSFNKQLYLSQLVHDTELSQTIQKTAQDLDARYSLSKKQTQIDSLNRTKEIQQLQLSHHRIIVWSLVIAIFVLVCIGLQYYKNISQKRNLHAAESALNRQRIQQLEKEKQLAAAEAVLQGQDEERTRLAKDLHDGLGGMLSGIKFSFDHMKENLVMTPDNQQSFARSMDMLDTSIKELRRVAHNMMPESLLKFGLDASLEDMCSYAASSGQSAVKYQSYGLKEAAIDRNVAVNIYRIIQELLNNALKHAQAGNILVQLLLRDNQFSITVEDDGKGFDKENAEASGGIGWSNIRNRVAYLNGKLEVESSANKGTSVSISINAAHS